MAADAGVASRVERAADWLVGVVSPGRAHLRRHFRRMDRDPDYRDGVLATLRARGYRAAEDAKNQTPFRSTINRSADSEVLLDRPVLTAKARELGRDDPLASGLCGTFTTNVVGSGMSPQSVIRRPDRKATRELRAACEAVWAERCGYLDPANGHTHGEHQRLVFGRLFEDGDVLVHRMKRAPMDPVRFEVVECDRIMTPVDLPASQVPADHTVTDGVQKDADGIPVGYWVAKVHPGGSPTTGMFSNAARIVPSLSWREFSYVPASEARHLKVASRPGQTRGVPKLTAVIQDLRDLDLLMIAALKRTQVAACLAVFLKSSAATPSLVPATAEKYGYRLDQDIEPGMIFKLLPNESIETLVPNFPTPELAAFVIMLARRIGAALGVSWQIVLKDFSGSTYSSARTDLLETRAAYKVLGDYLRDALLVWEWQSVLEDAILRGDQRLRGLALTMEDASAVAWIAPGWQWVDPLKEAQAIALKLEAGLTCLRDEAAALGKDWEDLLAQRLEEEKREMELREEMGLGPAPAISPTLKVLPGGDAPDAGSTEADAGKAPEREAA